MLDRVTKFVDNLTTRPFTQRVLREVVTRAEHLANSNPKLYDGLMLCYSLVGWLLLIGFFALIPLVIISLQFGSLGFETGQIDSSTAEALKSFRPTDAYVFDQIWRFALVMAGLIVLILIRFRFGARAPYSGMLLLRSEAPELFKAIDEAANKFQSKIDKVFITEKFNCAVSASPKLTGEQHYLYLGYPCLASLSAVQFKAILAHELAHVSLRHSAAQNWWQTQKQAWFTLMDGWRKRHPYIYIPFNLLLFWYTPIFAALAFVRAKQQEFEADEGARVNTSQDLYAKALLSFTIKKNLFEKAFNAQLGELLNDTKGDGSSLFDKAVKACSIDSQDEVTRIWKLYCQGIDEKMTATHPCLVRRLQRLGLVPASEPEKWNPDWQAILDNQAERSLTLLGDAAPRFAQRMGRAFSQDKMSHDVSRDHAHFVRGNANYGAKRLPEAIADFSEAIRLNPSFVDAYLSRASVLIEQGQPEKAIADCDKALALRPGHALAFSLRTIANQALGKWDDAIRDATAYVELSPDSWQAYSLRAKAYAGLKRKAEAIRDLSKAIELNPNEANFYLSRAALLEEIDDLEGARTDFEKSLALPLDSNGFKIRTYVACRLKQWHQAVADGDACLSRGEKDEYLLANHAKALQALGRNEQALSQLNEAISKKEHPRFLATRARTYHALNRDTEALNDINKAIKLAPEGQFFAVRAEIYRALGKTQEAEEDEKSAQMDKVEAAVS